MEKTLQIKESSLDNRLNRWFMILKIVLFCMPFLYLGYIGIGFGGAKLDVQEVLADNPSMAISFLSAMIQPYVGWILILSQRRLEDDRTPYAMINLAFLFLSELLMMSTVGVIGFTLILWRCKKYTGLGPIAAFRKIQSKNLLTEVGGSVVVLFLASVCFFASMQIGAF